MGRACVITGSLVLAVVLVIGYFVLTDVELRGAALESTLQPIAHGKDPDASVVAKAILGNHRETRQIAALWSGLYWGFSWLAAILSVLAGVVLKLESVDAKHDKIKKDIAAILSVSAALLVTISTGGDFQRKWHANRTAAAEIERIGYELVQHKGANARNYLADVRDSLQRRHAAILGNDQRKSADESDKTAVPQR